MGLSVVRDAEQAEPVLVMLAALAVAALAHRRVVVDLEVLGVATDGAPASASDVGLDAGCAPEMVDLPGALADVAAPTAPERREHVPAPCAAPISMITVGQATPLEFHDP